MLENHDYLEFRGKCKEYSEKLVTEDPSLRLVRGYYHCPFWGKQAHWWCETPEGKIIDPTSKQFPYGGAVGEYEEFDGTVECSNCGKVGREEEFSFESNYCFLQHSLLHKICGFIKF